MLVLTRSKDTVVHIGDDITVTVREIAHTEAVIQVDYPPRLALKIAGRDIQGESANAHGAQQVGWAAGPQSAAPLIGQPGPPAGDPCPHGQPGTAAGCPVGLRALIALKLDEAVLLGDEIVVKVAALPRRGARPCKVRIGVEAPKSVRISRSGDRLDGPPTVPGGHDPGPRE